MRILPVIDLLHGQVVRGIAGRRAEYQPIRSKLTDSAAPMDVARAFREHFGLTEIYLADLDAIGGSRLALDVYDLLQREGFRLWIDAGLRHAGDARPLLELGVGSVIAGLETIGEPQVLQSLLRVVSPDRLVFSLDMKGGQPLTARTWEDHDAMAIAQQAVRLGVKRMLILDLANVGVGCGVGTAALCQQLRQMVPQLEIATGGGVRHQQDVEVLRNIGVDWLLIASALHDGRVTRERLAFACGLAPADPAPER